ncbi:MAG: S1 RNA-binding domain-containing protein [Bacilli bacterium]|nr:S1 RNA-binding domain-containing protein [Bacilli bacterium]
MKKNIKYKKGDIIKGVVSGLTDYGIFMKIDNNYSGLIHISSISDKFVKNPGSYVKIGEIINAEILEIDKKNFKMKLSIKNIRYKDKYFVDRRIIETEHGFATLKTNLPIWIENNLKSKKNI